MPDKDKLKSEFQPKAQPPELTVYQICILNAIGHSELKSVEIRETLVGQGFEQKVSGFGDTMRRLEKRGLVISRLTRSVVDGYTITEKNLRVSDQGFLALENAKQFLTPIIHQVNNMTCE